MPIRFILTLRRLSYLQHILKQHENNTLLFQFFMAQLENPKYNDWVTTVMKDLEMVNIDLEIVEIRDMSEDKFKTLCKEKVKEKAFEYLIQKQKKRNPKHSIRYPCLEMSSYLKEDEFGISVKEKHNLFKCRMNDIDVKGNRTWKYDNLTCRGCQDPNEIENQEHVLLCKNLINKNSKVSYIPVYQGLYSDDIQEQIYTSIILCENLSLVPK